MTPWSQSKTLTGCTVVMTASTVRDSSFSVAGAFPVNGIFRVVILGIVFLDGCRIAGHGC